MNFTPAQFSKFMFTLARQHDHALKKGLEEAGKYMEKETKALLGNSQPEWPALTEQTQRRREAKGYTPDDPEYASGDMHDSIKHKVLDAHHVVWGTNVNYAEYQEFGTDKIPPRPFFALAAARHGEQAVKKAVEPLHRLLQGKTP